ncbi:MAG: tetratricopeptide repeat protein [Myxococcaceae bacterium]
MKPLKFAILFAASALALVACKTPEVVAPPPVVKVDAPPPKVKTPEDAFKAGVASFDAGKYDDAAADFAKALEKQPSWVNAQYNLGVVAERQGQLGKAEAAYEAAHALDAAHSPTLLNLGRVYRLQDKFEKAIALYEVALRAPGKEYDTGLLNNLTVAYRLAKKFDKAEASARKVLSRTKDNPDAYKNLALIYYDQGNYRLAEFISANAKKLDEKDPGVYNNLGMIYLKLDERRSALGQFQKSVALSDKFAPGHMNIGAMALSYRDYDTAEKSFSRAVGLDPSSWEGHLAYAYALDGQKGRDPKKGPLAGAEFEKVLTFKPDQTDAICGAGWAYATDKTGWDKAVTFLQKCKAVALTSPQDVALIEAKLRGIEAMQKSGAIQPAAAQPKDKPKATGGPSLLDKVSDEAAKEGEPAPTPEGEKPAGDGAAPAPPPAPAPGATPAAGGPAAAPAPAAAPPAAPAAAPEPKK